jgi:hypothetical protein
VNPTLLHRGGEGRRASGEHHQPVKWRLPLSEVSRDPVNRRRRVTCNLSVEDSAEEALAGIEPADVGALHSARGRRGAHREQRCRQVGIDQLVEGRLLGRSMPLNHILTYF